MGTTRLLVLTHLSPYHLELKVIFDDLMMMKSSFYFDILIFIVIKNVRLATEKQTMQGEVRWVRV